MQFYHQRMNYLPEDEMDYPDLTEALQKLVEKYGKKPFNCVTKAANEDNPYFNR